MKTGAAVPHREPEIRTLFLKAAGEDLEENQRENDGLIAENRADSLQ